MLRLSSQLFESSLLLGFYSVFGGIEVSKHVKAPELALEEKQTISINSRSCFAFKGAFESSLLLEF